MVNERFKVSSWCNEMFPYYGCTYLNTVKSIELYILLVNSMAWVISQYIHFSKEKLKIKNLVYLYECMPVGMHATCVGHLQMPERSLDLLVLGLQVAMNCQCWCQELNLYPLKISKYSWLLSHLSSPRHLFFKLNSVHPIVLDFFPSW